MSVVQFAGRPIPLDDDGDPCFTILEQIKQVFSEAEIVELINRQLRATQMQRTSARKYAAVQRERQKLLNNTLRRMFGCTSAKATPAQIDQAFAQIAKEVVEHVA